jgi:hypothetical protein
MNVCAHNYRCHVCDMSPNNQTMRARALLCYIRCKKLHPLLVFLDG